MPKCNLKMATATVTMSGIRWAAARPISISPTSPWAGITAGKAPSFYSFTGGGAAWYNFFSPDQQGFNQPDLLAYTASFGGGFSATVAAQSPGSNGSSGGGTWENG